MMTFAYCSSLYFLKLLFIAAGIYNDLHDYTDPLPSSEYYLPLGLLVNEWVESSVCRYLSLWFSNVVIDWFQPFPSRAAASALPPRASSRARCQSLRIPGHPLSAILFLCPPFFFASVSAISFLCPPFCFWVRRFASVSAILLLCPPFCFFSMFSPFCFCVHQFALGAWGQPFSLCVKHFLSVSTVLFLCPPFWFQVIPFCRVRLQIFLSCSYSISSFLSKTNSDGLFKC